MFYVTHYICLSSAVDNPDFYCCSCWKILKNESVHNFHLRKFHQMCIPIIGRIIIHPNITPNIYDPQASVKYVIEATRIEEVSSSI